MKKLFTLTLAVILIVSSLGTTYALESGVTSFGITPIQANQKHKYMYVTITAPKTQENSKLFVGFYTDGVLTRLTPYDVSTKTQFTKQKINTYVTIKDPEGNYFLDQTPDEIKIFTWDQTSLAPKTLCDNVLTQEVIDAANADVIESLAIIPEATEFIRKNRLISKEDLSKDEYKNYAEWDEHIYNIMDYLDSCTIKCVEDAKEQLMMSLRAQNLYNDDLGQVRSLANSATSRQKTKLKLIITESTKKEEAITPNERYEGIGIPKKYVDALNNAMKFLDFSLTEV